MEVELVDDDVALTSILPEWSALAARAPIRTSAPSWLVGWWRHLRPDDARLAVVTVRERGRLTAIAPFFFCDSGRRVDYRLLGAGTLGGLSPVSLPNREWDAAGLIAETLACRAPSPDIVAFEGTPLGSVWPALLRERWPGVVRPSAMHPWILGAPTVTLGQDSFDAWMKSRSSNFRSQMRRMRRQLGEAGGTVRESDAETLQADAEAMLRLHASRWDGRGDSALTPVADRLVRLLVELGQGDAEDDILRLQVVEVEGEPISVQAFVSTGGLVVYWNGGWDERFAKLKPAMLGILEQIERSIERGDDLMSLGSGMQPYKLRFADGVRPMAWGHLVIPGARAPATLATLAPKSLRTGVRRLARRGLTAERRDQLVALRRRLP